MASLLELQDLYTEAMSREIVEKTKSGGLNWTHLGGTQFQSTEVAGSITWDLFVTKTQIGNLTYKYSLDVKKDAVAFLTTESGALPHTNRDSVVKDLYEIVEVIVLQLDVRLKEALDVIKGL